MVIDNQPTYDFTNKRKPQQMNNAPFFHGMVATSHTEHETQTSIRIESVATEKSVHFVPCVWFSCNCVCSAVCFR